MLGKGLSSLIPNKEEGEKEAAQTVSSGEKDFERQSFGSLAHERLSRSPSFSPQKDLSRHSGKEFNKTDSIFQLEVEKIKPNPYQPRQEFNQESLRELADSIRAHGILQPLIVSKIEKETETGTEVEYQLIAGERRLMAAKMIGLERAPAIIRKVDDRRLKLEMALIENIQRSNLNPIEAARAYARLAEEFNLTQQEIGVRVGKSRETVANTLRLLKLPPAIQEALSGGRINESQARTLLTIESVPAQEKAFAALLADKLSVRELQEKTIKEKISDPQQVYWERQLEEKVGAPVKLIKRGPKGKLVIHFHSEEEWQDLLKKLIGPDF